MGLIQSAERCEEQKVQPDARSGSSCPRGQVPPSPDSPGQPLGHGNQFTAINKHTPSRSRVLTDACPTGTPALHTSPAWAYLGLPGPNHMDHTNRRVGEPRLALQPPPRLCPTPAGHARTWGTGDRRSAAVCRVGKCSASAPRREPSPRTLWWLARSHGSLTGSQAWTPLKGDAAGREDRRGSNTGSREWLLPKPGFLFVLPGNSGTTIMYLSCLLS